MHLSKYQPVARENVVFFVSYGRVSLFRCKFSMVRIPSQKIESQQCHRVFLGGRGDSASYTCCQQSIMCLRIMVIIVDRYMCTICKSITLTSLYFSFNYFGVGLKFYMFKSD